MKLSVKDLFFSYSDGKEVLKEIAFSLRPKEICTLLGPNGSGKSTLIKCLNRLLKPRRGTVLIDDTELKSFTDKEVAKRISYLPQDQSLSFSYSVFHMVLIGRTPYINPFSVPKQEDFRAVYKALEMVGISHLAHRNFFQLSGGQKKLVLIARALAQDTEILLLDECGVSHKMRKEKRRGLGGSNVGQMQD